MDYKARSGAWFAAGLGVIGLGGMLLLSAVPAWLVPVGWAGLFVGAMMLGISANVWFERGTPNATAAGASAPPLPSALKTSGAPYTDDQGRVFVNVNVKDIHAALMNHTTDQSTAILAPYLGKWLRYSGTVFDVDRYSITLSVEGLKTTSFPASCAHALLRGAEQVDRLKPLADRDVARLEDRPTMTVNCFRQ